MEFESQDGNRFDSAALDGTDGANLQDAAAPSAGSPGRGPTRVLAVGSDGVVVLPAGTQLDDIQVDGRDLVIVGENGVRYVIPDGAIVVPQIVVEGVAIPPANLAALLTGMEPEPAAGATRSSGGNFASPVGPLQAAYGLGNLLPYTELNFPEPEEREIIPQFVDREPGVIIITPNQPAGATDATAQVNEAGLPKGSNAPANSETTTGTLVFEALDGLGSIALDGVAITAVGQTFTSPNGVLTITSIAPGVIGYSYTLTTNLIGQNMVDSFVVTVTDTDGDVATASLDISVIDDVPTARDDTDAVAAGTYGPETGNVMTGGGTTSGSAGADTQGADGASVSAISGAGGSDTTFNAGGNLVVTGQYGTLTIKADGSYSYVRAPGTPGGVTDTFTYTLTDGDGSSDTATLAIAIGDSPATVISVPTTGAGTIVNEAGLPTRPGEAPGTNAPAPTETTRGTITVTAPDGPLTVAIGGVVVTGPGQIIPLPQGSLTVTSYNPATGEVGYSFTLADNTSGDTTVVSIPVTVTDVDGDSDTKPLVITIVDDAPVAVNDSATQAAENAAVTVNVFANDIQGADSVQVSTVTLVPGTLSGTGTLANNGDGTFTYTPGPGEQGDVTFQYSITDGDGDSSTATVTIALLPDSTPTIATAGDTDVLEAGLPARGGEPAGTQAAGDGEFASGTIAITTGGDTIGSLTINGQIVTGGGTVTTSKGTLTVAPDGAGGYTYTYQLTDNTLTDPDSDSFQIVITDSDGSPASATLAIAIVDDSPSAADDTAALPAGSFGPIGGNVVANDTPGADGVAVTSYTGTGAAVATGAVAQGQYGTLTIAADGTFSYTRDPGTKGGVSDTFTYTITDGDGDIATATLTITIPNGVPTLDVPVAGDAGTQVLEAGLPAGSAAATDGEFTSGTIAFTAIDGPAILTIDGQPVTVGATFKGTSGTLTVTAIGADTISYTYELTTNTSGDATFDDFLVRVTDQDGDFVEDALTIDIVDDVPTARPDADTVTEDGPLTASGNVVTDVEANGDNGADTTGADGASVTTIEFGGTAGTVGAPLSGDYGSLTIGADGSYTYTLDNSNPLVQGLDSAQTLTETFTYTLTDGDTDARQTTLTITIQGADDGITITGLNAAGAELVFDEDDLALGSSPDATMLTKTGTFEVDAQDGIVTISVGGTVIYTGGAFVAGQTLTTPYGTLTFTGVTEDTVDASGDVTHATVSFSYTLNANTLTHVGADDVSLIDSYGIEVTDTDNTVQTDTLDIQLIDDVPIANDDIGPAFNQPSENQPFTIDALANDVFGADRVDTGDGTKVFVSTQAAQGTVTYDPATGLFTYTPDAGAGSTSISDSFVYTIVDRDGDIDTATVTVTLQPDSTPTGGTATATVDDDGLSGANPAPDAADIDANIGDDPADTSEASFTGTLTFSVGNDSPATISFGAALDGSTATVGLEQVTYSVAGSIVTATISSGARTGTALFEVEILDPAAGTYQVRLLDNVLNAGGPNGEATDATAAIAFQITDSDNSTGSTNLSIVFNDDRPSAYDDGGAVDEGGSTGGNVLTDGIDDVFGADDGQIQSFTDGVTTLAPGGQIETTLGFLTINGDGSYTYVSKANSTNVPVNDTFTYTIVDGDGDTSTATLTIAITPAAGAVSDSDVNVDEAGLGNAAYTGSDPAAPSEIGTGSITVTAGGVVQAPGDFTYALIGANSNGDGTYGTLVLNAADGTYTYTLDTPYTDAVEPNEYTRNIVNGAESFQYEVRDSLGNVVGTGFIAVNIKDDVPTAQDYAGGTFAEGSGDHIIGDAATLLGIVEGADGLTGPLQSIAFTNTGTTGGSVAINAAGELVYTSPTNVTSAATVTETFSYRITDTDGDTVTKTVTFGVSDTGIANPAATDVSVDEDDIAGAGGNPVGPGDLPAPVPSGTISYTAGQDAITAITLSTGALGFTKLDGTAITTSYDSTTGVLTGYGTGPADVVFTITLGAIGQGSTTYTVDLLQPVKHTVTDDPATGAVETAFEDDKTFTVNVVVTDADGSTANTSFGVLIDDDSPVASTVNAVQGTENTAFDIPLAGSFSAGADGLGSIVLGTASQGTLVLNGTTVTYTPNSGAGSTSTSDSFTYTIIDKDGDAVTQTVNVTLKLDSTPTGVAANAFVDDDGLAGGNPGGTGDDNQNRASEYGAGVNNEAIFTGFITSTTGSADGPLSYSFAAAAGTATVGTETVTLTWSGSTLTATVAAGQARAGTVLFTVDVVQATGAYTVTLKAPIAHETLNGLAGDNTENNASVVLSYTVKDSDTNPVGGDTATGSLTIDFDDDTPTAVANTNTVNEGGSAAGDVDTNDVYGADGPAAGGGVVGVRAGSDTTTAASGNLGGAGITTALGTLVLNADGTYTYTAKPNTITAQTTDTFTYTIQDADGDLSTTTLTITVDPVNLTGVTGNVIVYEKALDTTVNPGDVAAGTVTGSDPTNTGETATGNVTVAGATSYSITGGTDNGTTITKVGTYGTIVIVKATGAYTYTLTSPFTTTPAANDGVTTQDDAEFFTYTASDANGNTVSGVINVDIVDDVPNAYATAPTTAMGVNVGTGAESADYSLNLPDVGADKPGSVTFTAASGQQAFDTSGNALTFNGQEIYYTLNTTDPTILEARTSATPGGGTLVFEIDLDPATGTYTYTQFEQLSTAVLVPITNLSSIGGGNIAAKAIDVPNTPLDIILTTKSGATVNTNATQIGIGAGQSFSANDVIRIDLVQNVAVTKVNGNDTLTFGEYYSANSFREDVSGVGGGSGGGGPQRADFTVRAYTVVEAPGSTPSQPADGDGVFYGDTNDVLVTDTELNIYDQNGVLQTTAQLTAAGVTVTETSPGVWQVLNLPNGYDYEIVSDSTAFQAVEVQALASSDTFKLGAITINALQVQGSTFEVPIALTDADGDQVTNSITVQLASPTTPIVLDLDGDGAEFLSMAAGVSHDYGFGAVATAWAGADDALLARDTGHSLDIVFSDDASGAESDLDGLRMAHDSNADGQLTSADTDWSTFGIWQDANANGVVDAGEFISLDEAGITAIGLTSDGAGYTAADGNVAVFGTGSYTRADGSTGALADAAFATEARNAQRTAELVTTAAVAGAVAHASAAAAAAPGIQDGAHQSVEQTVYTKVDAASVELGTDASLAANIADLLGAHSAQLPEMPEAASHSYGDAPAHVGSDMPVESAASLPDQAHADSASVFAFSAPLFADAGSEGTMAALMAMGQGTGSAEASPIAMAQVQDALSDHGNALMIDGLVDHFAGAIPGDGPAFAVADINGSDMASAVLAQTLDSGMTSHFQFVMPDIAEDAHALATAAA